MVRNCQWLFFNYLYFSRLTFRTTGPIILLNGITRSKREVHHMTRYIPLLRPASFSTLPQGLEWTYVEAPSYVTKRPDLPRSSHAHGVIECRELTVDEQERFDLRPVA